MEENSEVHMETDVSSTTEDVPETQEVTGSHGNVEMIIVIEKVEEDMDPGLQTDKEPSQIGNISNDVLESVSKSPQKDLQSQLSYLKSPEKVNETQKSPNKLVSALKLPTSSIQENEVQPSVQTEQIEVADSSSKEPLSLEDKKGLNKIQDVLKPIQKSPIKNVEMQELVTSKPVPKTVIKDIQPQEIYKQKSPAEDVQRQEINKQKTPMKDIQPQEVNKQKTPIKDIQMREVSKQKTPINDTQPQEINKQNPTVKDVQGQEINKQKPPVKDVKPQELSKQTIIPIKEFTLPENSIINGKIQTHNTMKEHIPMKHIDTHSSIIPIDITVEREASNDSQVESNIDPAEKDHNKSISRELKSLINSAKESKIISECTQLTSKTRKSRSALDTSSTGLNTSMDAEKIQGTRRSSNNSQKSNCSGKSDKTIKRSMRSQNPEFVSKVKQFLNSVTGKGQRDSDDEDDEVEQDAKKTNEKAGPDEPSPPAPKMKKTENFVTEKIHKLRSDTYCWRCHWAVEQAANEKAHSPMTCTVCPRSFHFKCLSGNERSKINTEKNWVCPDCMIILQAESSETRSPAMKKISLGMLCDLLKHALERMMDLNGVEPFMQPVDRSAFPDYDKYVVHPMDLTLMKDNIAEGLYGSTEAFLADAQWILHNSIIFNTLQSKLTGGARALVRSCRAEVAAIEACPECYAGAHARRATWFTDVCSTPHILLWAKLKGFPYWPAKGMSVSSAGHVDVRFFGAHDRAWVPAKDCFLFSEKDPNNFRNKRQDILDSMQEAEQHIRNISRKYGKFVYPPFKTQFEPTKLTEQLKMMIPSFEGEVRSALKDKATVASPAPPTKKRRSNSKSSKESLNDGDISESEDASAVSSRKMADGAEIAREEEDSMATPEKNNISIDIATLENKGSESSRKRRRSDLEEAVITIIEKSSLAEKRKRVDEEKAAEKKTESQESTSSKDIQKRKVTENHKDVEMIDVNKVTSPEAKDNEPSSNTSEKDKKDEKKINSRVTPIKIAFVQKDKKNTSKAKEAKIISANKETAKNTTPNKDNGKVNKEDTPKSAPKDDKITPQHQKTEKSDRSANSTPRDDKLKSEKRRNSKSNKSLNQSNGKDKNVGSLNNSNTKDKNVGPLNNINGKDKNSGPLNNNNGKDKNVGSLNNSNAKDNTAEKKMYSNNEKTNKPKEATVNKEKETEKAAKEKQTTSKPNNTVIVKSVKDRLQFDDDTTLAVIARESVKTVVSTNATGLPTISSVRSLSTIAQNATTTTTKPSNVKSIEVTIEANSESSIFTPTSTDNVKTMKDAVSKLQKLRNETEPVVGRVGVRAFARMTSPEKQTDDVQVEIKAEPIDLDEPERHMEKMDLMNAFRLRPVNPQSSSLREVRINKVVVAPLSVQKAVEPRPRAKKTFPQPKKDDGRSELNGKNSMVYIPIQPPSAPVRVRAGPHGAPAAVPQNRPPVHTTVVTAVTSPVMQVSAISVAASSAAAATVGQVPTTVHTVPLMTSVNGQWMFSFQPVMSVGAIDAPSPPLMNGVVDRGTVTPATAPAVNSGNTTAQRAGPQPALPQPVQPQPRTVTPTVAAPDTNTPGELPRLQQRPTSILNPVDPSTPIGIMPTPSAAGPLTAKLNQSAVKLADFFRSLLEDSLEKLDDPAAQLTALRLQLEQTAWKHKQEIEEIKHNQELTLAEMRGSFEKEKMRALKEARQAAQTEREFAVKLAKSKQWCANCSQEAQFYCCWNTSYCDYPCQRAHWALHYSVCTQQRDQDGSSENDEILTSPERRLQPQPDNLPVLQKNSPAPALTVGGKLAPSRVYTQDQARKNSQKHSIIVSMVEDPNGNQTMKCVGTYKPPAPTQMTPVILNNQLLNNEEAVSKKVVSSGGYLIVGGRQSTPHSVQYYT